MKIDEVTTKPPQNSDEARLNALKLSADAAKKRLGVEKQRQRVQKAQKALQKALRPTTPLI